MLRDVNSQEKSLRDFEQSSDKTWICILDTSLWQQCDGWLEAGKTGKSFQNPGTEISSSSGNGE